jgi:rubrerythrin
MSIIRTDDEADAVEMLKLVIETTDYYKEMADVVEDDNLAGKLTDIAHDRADYIKPFENLVKELGELPVQPDPDKELAQKIGGELTRFFSADEQNAILDKCLQEDEELAGLLERTKLGEKSAEFRKLLDALSDNLGATKNVIKSLKD